MREHSRAGLKMVAFVGRLAAHVNNVRAQRAAAHVVLPVTAGIVTKLHRGAESEVYDGRGRNRRYVDAAGLGEDSTARRTDAKRFRQRCTTGAVKDATGLKLEISISGGVAHREVSDVDDSVRVVDGCGSIIVDDGVPVDAGTPVGFQLPAADQLPDGTFQ